MIEIGSLWIHNELRHFICVLSLRYPEFKVYKVLTTAPNRVTSALSERSFYRFYTKIR